MGYVEGKYSAVGTKLKVKMQNSLWDCEVVEDSPYDPNNQNIRIDS